MALNQKNLQTFTYVDNGGKSWNKRGVQDTAINAIDGSAPLNAANSVWPFESRRFHVRKAVFYDPATFRTVRIIIYTQAAMTTILTTPPTLAVSVPSQVGPVNYSLRATIDEKQPRAATARQLIDHP
jgi:hypothetical protein